MDRFRPLLRGKLVTIKAGTVSLLLVLLLNILYIVAHLLFKKALELKNLKTGQYRDDSYYLHPFLAF